MLNQRQLATMFELQDGMNTKVNPNWIEAAYPFLRAAALEGAEAIEHHGWKWWKKQEIDLPQLQMELVDIWHFALSHQLLETNNDKAQAAADFIADSEALVLKFDGKDYVLAELDLLQKLELMIGLATARRFSVPLFAVALTDCQMTWDDLYKQYVGKNVLNFFRQDHGYKDGTYIKVWNGKEDNEHLSTILDSLDVEAEGVADTLYKELKAIYDTL